MIVSIASEDFADTVALSITVDAHDGLALLHDAAAA